MFNIAKRPFKSKLGEGMEHPFNFFMDENLFFSCSSNTRKATFDIKNGRLITKTITHHLGNAILFPQNWHHQGINDHALYLSIWQHNIHCDEQGQKDKIISAIFTRDRKSKTMDDLCGIAKAVKLTEIKSGRSATLHTVPLVITLPMNTQPTIQVIEGDVNLIKKTITRDRNKSTLRLHTKESGHNSLQLDRH